MGTINIQSTDLSHKAGLTYTGTSDKTIDVNNVLQTSDTTASIANGKVVVNSSGNVGIGTSNPAVANKLQVLSTVADNGVGIGGTTKQLRLSYDATGNYSQINSADWGTGQTDLSIGGLDLLFKTGVYSLVERMRIDSNGNLLVGTTDSSYTTGNGLKYRNDSIGRNLILNSPSSANVNEGFMMYSTGAGAYRFYVQWDGKINATSTTIAAISDERLKENIRDLDFGLSDVLSLKPRRFDWKEGKGPNIKDAVGFIAQEFETVFPASVGLSKAGEDGVEYKNICHEELIPTLVKAIQEQQAIITDLTARIVALEAK